MKIPAHMQFPPYPSKKEILKAPVSELMGEPVSSLVEARCEAIECATKGLFLSHDFNSVGPHVFDRIKMKLMLDEGSQRTIRFINRVGGILKKNADPMKAHIELVDFMQSVAQKHAPDTYKYMRGLEGFMKRRG